MKISYAVLVALLVIAAIFLEADAQNRGQNGRPGQRRRDRERRRRQRDRRNRRRDRTRIVTPRPCPPIPVVPFGAALHDGTNTEQQYACQQGFTLVGTDTITCVDGVWTVAPRCVQQSCPLPPSVPFATYIQTNFGLEAQYTCSSGYRLANGHSGRIICNFSTQSWQTAPSCEVIPILSCGSPPTISFATSAVSASGTQATYTCNTGYQPVSGRPTIIICLNFQWPTTNLPACEAGPIVIAPTSCGKPPCGGSTIDPGPTGDTTAINGTVVYTCRDGMRIAGENDNSIMTFTSTCLTNGSWSNPPICEPKMCPAPLEGLNTASPVVYGTRVGDITTYSCIANHQITNAIALTRTCQADGSWSGTPPICTPIQCSTTPTIANANAEDTNPRAVGENLRFDCATDYVLFPKVSPSSGGSNTFTVICQADGTFSTTTERCVFKYPVSCAEFIERSAAIPNPVTTVAVDAVIDIDGSGATAPITIQCRAPTTGQSCTQIAPLTGTATLESPATVGLCAATTASAALGSALAVPPQALCSTDFQVVQYPLTETQLTTMFTSGAGTCTQVVTYTCASGATFFGLTLNRAGTTTDSARLYAYPAAPGVGFLASIGETGSCDCSGTVGTCGSGCNCATGAGQDTVTLNPTGTVPTYVKGIILGTEDNTDPGGAGTTPIDTDISVGAIECCTS